MDSFLTLRCCALLACDGLLFACWKNQAGTPNPTTGAGAPAAGTTGVTGGMSSPPAAGATQPTAAGTGAAAGQPATTRAGAGAGAGMDGSSSSASAGTPGMRPQAGVAGTMQPNGSGAGGMSATPTAGMPAMSDPAAAKPSPGCTNGAISAASPRTSVGNPCSTEVQAVFKRLNNCTGGPKKTFDGVCETLDQCAQGSEVTICMVEAQHTTIYQNPDIDMYEDGWAYSKKYYIH